MNLFGIKQIINIEQYVLIQIEINIYMLDTCPKTTRGATIKFANSARNSDNRKRKITKIVTTIVAANNNNSGRATPLHLLKYEKSDETLCEIECVKMK